MKTVNNSNVIFPNIWDNLFLENRIDALNNYETFSTPAINIIESLSNFVIEVAAPGLEKSDFLIEVEEDTLKIISKRVKVQENSKENKEENKNEDKPRYRKREFNYSNFERNFKLPENIEVENIEAKYENGILRISLPIKEEKKALKKMVEIS